MPIWVRVRDTTTGHQFDVRADTLPRKGLEPVDRVPNLSAPNARPRPAKPNVTQAGKPTTSKAAPKSDGQKEKESDNG